MLLILSLSKDERNTVLALAELVEPGRKVWQGAGRIGCRASAALLVDAEAVAVWILEHRPPGAVENLVGSVRRNALVPVPDFPSWEALNAHLLAWCEGEGRRLDARWQQERAALRPLPAQPFRCAQTWLATVNRLSLVPVGTNRYSAPCRYVGRTLRLALFTEQVELDTMGRGPVRGRASSLLPAGRKYPLLGALSAGAGPQATRSESRGGS